MDHMKKRHILDFQDSYCTPWIPWNSTILLGLSWYSQDSQRILMDSESQKAALFWLVWEFQEYHGDPGNPGSTKSAFSPLRIFHCHVRKTGTHKIRNRSILKFCRSTPPPVYAKLVDKIYEKSRIIKRCRLKNSNFVEHELKGVLKCL